MDYDSRWFDDVDGSPYGDEINALAALGVLLGNETGEFNPQGQLTRGELVSMMVQGMGYWCWQSQGTAPFTDVSREDWYATVVDIAYNLGLIQGNEDGEFRADDPVDHQQFLTILARMGARADLSIQQKLEQVTEEETASEAVQAYEPWARAAVAAAKDLGFLAVPLEELDPSTSTTREEAAAMLYRMLDYIGTITPVTGNDFPGGIKNGELFFPPAVQTGRTARQGGTSANEAEKNTGRRSGGGADPFSDRARAGDGAHDHRRDQVDAGLRAGPAGGILPHPGVGQRRRAGGDESHPGAQR